MIINPFIYGGGGGGGGGLTPILKIDFKNGSYAINGVTQTMADLLTEDANNFGTFISDIVPGVGLRVSGASFTYSAPVLSAGAFALVSPAAGGATMVMTFTTDGTICSVAGDITTLPDYSPDWTAGAVNDGGQSSLADSVAPSVPFGFAQQGSNKVAFTYEASHLAVSMNGDTVQSLSSPADNSSATNIDFSVSVTPSEGTVTCVLESVYFYAVQPDEDLPSLSAS